MITDDELAAIAAALTVALRRERESASPEGSTPEPIARWKYADRNPDLEIEDYRSV